MDEIRDIQKQDILSRFFDRRPLHTNPFGTNQSADRAYRRAERIVAGLYLATNHLSENEALRSGIRAGGLELFNAILELRNEMRGPESQPQIACKAIIRRMISMVRMLAASGSLSIPNANILLDALDELGAFLNAATNTPLSESLYLNKDMLTDRTYLLKDIKDRIKDTSPVKDDKGQTPSKTLSVSLREQNILSILRTIGSASIKDISSQLPEYGEKTIQRELNDLIVQGLVRRDGLRRWSRYTAASSKEPLAVDSATAS